MERAGDAGPMERSGALHEDLTISDALAEFESKGYAEQFVVKPDGTVECEHCGSRAGAEEVVLEEMERIEGASDPDDMVFVGAMRCPRCSAGGTAVLKFGPTADPADVDVLRRLQDERVSHALSQLSEEADHSLVRDSGWLPGPDADR